MAATPRSGPTVFLACPALSSSSSSNGESAISPVFSRQIRKTLVACCAKKSRSEKQKLEEMSALYSGSLSDKRKGKLLKSLSMDLSAVSATLHQPHFCAEEIDKSLVDQVRRQILEGAVDVLKTQLDQARKEYRERKQQLKTNKKKNS